MDYNVWFDKLDTDKDGTVDYDEFINAGYDRAQLISKENLKVAFDSIDHDGDGSLDVQELRELFSNGVKEELFESNQIALEEEQWANQLD